MRRQGFIQRLQKLIRKKITIGSIGISLVLGIGALLVGVPWAIKAFSIFQLEKMTGHDVTIEDVSLHYMDRRVTLTGFELRDPESNESLVAIDQLQIQFRLWALLKKHITLLGVVVDHPVVSVVRESDGALNFSRLRQKNSSSSEPSEFVTMVQDFKLKNGTVLYQDFTNPAHPQVRADGISLEVSDFSTKGQERFPFVLQGTLAKKGIVIAKGRMQVDPFSLESEWDIQNVHLSPYRDFISGIPSISGIVNSSFNLEIPSEGFSQVQITGNLAVNDVRMGAHSNPFLTGQQIMVSDVDFAGPDHLAISRVMLQKPSLEVIRDEQGTLPVLAHFQAKSPQKSPSSENKSGMTPIIDEIQLQDGRIRFIDESTQPEYRKELTRIMVKINQPASETSQTGHVTLTASTLDEESIAMEGDIRLFGGDFYLDVDGEVKKFSISSFNPYSEKFLGWGTRSGQLTTDIHVHIEEQHLRSKSKIGISDLQVVRAGTDDLVNKTLGLPLGLVVDLIKNINGDIKLKIEVEGPLNKPAFSIRDAILRSLRNAIVNLVTAPLRLIGSLVKGNSKIQKIDIHPILFKSGTNTMEEGMEERVEFLQTFLKKTPYIGLEVQPNISAGDLHMLRIMAVASRIAELEAQQSLSKGLEAAQTLYQEKFPDKTIPVEEVGLLKELVAIEPNPGERAAALGSERANMVIHRLTSSKDISPDRLHIGAIKEFSSEEDLGRLEFFITR